MKPLSQRPFLGARRNNVGRDARIVEMYTAGIGSHEIARRVGASVALVFGALDRAGIKRRTKAEGRALGMRRKARLQAIAEAAQRRFGHLFAPARVGAPPRPTPVNELFAESAYSTGVAFDVSDAWVAGS